MGYHILRMMITSALLTAVIISETAKASSPLSSSVVKKLLLKNNEIDVVPQHLFLLLADIMKQHLQDCHIAVFAQDSLGPLIGQFQESGIPAVAINSSELTNDGKRAYLRGHLGNREGSFPCRARVIDVTQNGFTALSFFEDLLLWKWPDTYIILYGELSGDLRTELMKYFTYRSLRNNVKTLFLVHSTRGSKMKVYSRCLFCNAGEVGVKLLDSWTPQQGYQAKANLFYDQFTNLYGHQFNLLGNYWDPQMKYTVPKNIVDDRVIVHDCVDLRAYNAMSEKLNFTFVFRRPHDGQWGRLDDEGNFNGIVGTLQREDADFSSMLGQTPTRLAVAAFTRIYTYEPLKIYSPKPQRLPNYLSIVRPYTEFVWALTVVSTAVMGILIWLVTKAVSKLTGEKPQLFRDSMFLTFGTLFEDIPPRHKQPKNMSSQILIGWWLVFCLILSNTYRAALLGILAIPKLTEPMDSLEKLRDNQGTWTFGMERWWGSAWEWLKNTEMHREVYERLMMLDKEDHYKLMHEGNHALITSPFSLGNHHWYVADTMQFQWKFCWGFRKGAPFLRTIDMIMQRLIETGHIKFWINDVLRLSLRDERMAWSEEKKLQEENYIRNYEAENSGQIILRVSHLEGAFYLLFMGIGFAGLVLIGEILYIKIRYKASKDFIEDIIKPEEDVIDGHGSNINYMSVSY